MLIPWRVKNFVSNRFPLLYHVMANLGVKGNSSEHWDSRLDDAWDAPIANWPTKNQLVASLTSPSEIILDLGCGTGSILRYLKSQGFSHLHGQEISGYAIKRLSADEGVGRISLGSGRSSGGPGLRSAVAGDHGRRKAAAGFSPVPVDRFRQLGRARRSPCPKHTPRSHFPEVQ